MIVRESDEDLDVIFHFSPDYTAATYCGLKNLAATLLSRFCFSTYVLVCLRRKIVASSRFAKVFQPS